jgi:hypothetical protein
MTRQKANPRIARAPVTNFFDGSIRAAVVDNDNFVLVLGLAQGDGYFG